MATAINIKANDIQPVKKYHQRWTTYSNISKWFDNWEKHLVELGFGEEQEGKLEIPPKQLDRILNLDENACTLDGNKGHKGGRPSVIFYDINLPRLGKAAAKSSLTTTFITGSTADGDALPLHFQFCTRATMDKGKKVCFDAAECMVNVRGKFGWEEASLWYCTFGMNDTDSMDYIKFEKYIMNLIVPLFPEAADCHNKRVLIKIGSGPGRLN